jgi:hypothetical protein
MLDSRRLRGRILSVLNAGLAVSAVDLAACGDSSDSGGSSLASVSCSTGTVQVQCWPPHETHFNVGNVPPGTPVSTPAPVFDQNGCQITDQVADGCCNPAAAGPEFKDGQCCYAFCAGTCCGRPLLVNGVPRLAPVVGRGDWGSPATSAVPVEGLAADERTRIAREWLLDAQMEHASIASFGRFALDLIAFGAPLDLVCDAQRAALDEVRHAQTCFAVASAYAGGYPYGSGALSLDGAEFGTTLSEAAVAAFREGCVGQTTAALVAGERHQLPPAASPAPSRTPSHAARRAHGRLSEGEVRGIERLAIRDVIRPCMLALLAKEPSRLRGGEAGPMLLGQT